MKRFHNSTLVWIVVASMLISLPLDGRRPDAGANAQDAAVPSQSAGSDSPFETESNSSELREWVDASGAHRIKARLISFGNGIAKLCRVDGKIIEVPAARLCDADRTFLNGSLDPHKKVLEGRVVSIADGDTLSVIADRIVTRIRLEGIDAPEMGQAFSAQSKKSLGEKVIEKTVRVEWKEADKYGRTLGHVYLDGRWINQQMVAEGLAWHFKKYSSDPQLAAAEDSAKANQLGLWSDASPIAPWDWRASAQTRKLAAELAVKKQTDDFRPNPMPAERTPSAPSSVSDGPVSISSCWITSSSGVRHNSSCKYFRNSNGRLCGPTEGRACKICGG